MLKAGNVPILTWVPDQNDDDKLINEGFIQAGLVNQPDATDSEYQTNGVIFSWDNWSLAAPLPVRQDVKDCDEIDHGNEPSQKLGLNARHKPLKGSLPKLEYGDGYRVRLRTVDLAGNSHSIGEAPDGGSGVLGDPYIYKRYEPIGVPEVLLGKPFHAEESPGEQLTQLVIRGHRTESADDSAERFLVAPRVTQQFAEMHGVSERFDPARGAFFDADLNPDGPYLVLRPDGTFIRACDVWHDCAEATCAPPSDSGSNIQRKPDADNAVYKFSTTERGELRNPFFPDPAAQFARILLRGFDPGGATTARLEFDLYRQNSWPNVMPFGITLQSAKGNQQEDARMEWLRSADPNGRRRDGAGDILAVRLKPSYTVHLLIHCLPSVDEFLPSTSHQGLRRVVNTFAFANDLSKQAQLILSSSGSGVRNVFQHWLLSSPLVLKLVHAVEKPLLPPTFSQLFVGGFNIGDTSVSLSGGMICHRRSTGKLEITSHWEEPFDDLSKADFDEKPVAHLASVLVRPLGVEESEEVNQAQPLPLLAGLEHDFGDTRYREVNYLIEASSRFKEYYPPSPDDSQRFMVRTPPAQEVSQTILNRARPALAVVNRVSPAFRWLPLSADDKRIIRRERTGLLRVWIERPWFSSGAREKLGVILLPSDIRPSQAEAEKLRTFISQWGVDPLWDSPKINQPLDNTHFVGFVDRDDHLKLEEIDTPVDVLAYDVAYDRSRHMWYSDIEVRPENSYFPFVRLALARYQRHSIPEVKLSGVTLADPSQIFPKRTASASRIQSHTWSVNVEGPSFDVSPERPKRNEIAFTIVERRSEDKTGTGWVPSRPEGRLVSVTVPADGPATGSTWRATLTLPERKRKTRYAIMIEEFETWQQDKEAVAPARRSFEGCWTTRLAYAERLEIK